MSGRKSDDWLIAMAAWFMFLCACCLVIAWILNGM